MKKHLLLLLCSLCVSLTLQAQFTVSNTSTPQQLVQNVLLGTGITVSNITYSGAPLQIGEFNNTGTNNLLLNHGIVLSSGATDQLDNFPTNASGSSTFAVTNPNGDPTLSSLAGGAVTNNAAILEFDFVPLSDTVKFRYVFASEEYNEWVCSSFNDIFAFLITGPGFAPNTNIAVIPGTSTPVSINSINIGTPGTSAGGGTCPGPNQSLAHANLFLNNPLGSANIIFDGLTRVLTAQAVVVPCQTYHIKLAIADVFDSSFDSGVFLEANSFTADVLDIAINSYLPDGQVVEGCTNAGVTLTLAAPTTTNYTIPVVSIGGTATQGVDYLNLPPALVIPAGQQSVTFTVYPLQDNVQEGPETVQVIFQSSICTQDTLNLIIREDGILDITQDRFAICTGDASTLQFNAVVYNDPGTLSGFSWSPTAGLSDPTVRNPTATVSQATTYTVTYNSGGCTQTADIEVLAPFDVVMPTLRDTSICGASTSIVLDATVPPNTSILNFAATTPVTVNPAQSIDIPIAVAGLPSPLIVNGMVQSICVDITQDPNAFQYYTELYLIAPTGEIITLSAQSGTGASFTNICFSPTATDSVGQYNVSAPLPSNVSLQPQDPNRFNDLAGATANGTWLLRVFNSVPASFGNFPLVVNSAALNFGNVASTSYVWTPATDLSCSTCPAPVCTPTASPRTYNVTATNGFGCSATQDVTIFSDAIGTPVLTCGTATNFSTQFNWTNIAGAAGYTVSINGGTPIPVGSATTYTVTGLTHPQSVTLTLVALAPAASPCTNSVPAVLTCSTYSCAPLPPVITGTTTFCDGSTTTLTAPAGFTYAWNTPTGIQTTQSVVADATAVYGLTITNNLGCTASASQTVTEFTSPVFNNVQEVCSVDGSTYTISFGITNGDAATYSVTGVTGTLTGSTFTSNPIANGQTPVITLTDVNNCAPVTYTGIGACQVPSYCSASTGCYGLNLIVDGNFETFNSSTPFTNFNSSYDFANCSALTNTCTANGVNILCQGDFSVGTVPTPCNPDWSNQVADHTSGSGNMMIVDFPANASSSIWCQSVTLPANTEYCFGTYAMNLAAPNSNVGAPRLRFVINGVDVGVSRLLPETLQWQFEGVDFNTGAGGSMNLCIYNDNFGAIGYDVALDDIVLRPLLGGAPPVTQPDAVFTCAATPVTVDVAANDNGGGSAIVPGSIIVESAPSVTAGTAQVLANHTIQFTPRLTFAGTAQFTYQICNVDGCCSIDTIEVEVAAPVLVNTGANQTICNGNNTNITAALTNGTAPFTYNWTNTNGSFTGTTATVNVAPTSADVYNVTVTDANGCTGTDQVTVLVVNIPTASIDHGTVQTLCLGQSLTLSALGGEPQATYIWGGGQTTQTITVTPTNVGQNNFNVTINNGNNCTQGATFSIIVQNVPTITLDSVDVECFGGNDGAVSVTASPAGNYNYFWTPGGYTTPSVPNLTAGTYTVRVSYVSGSTCSVQSTIVVNDGIQTTVNAGADVSINVGDDAILTATPNDPTYTYTWVGSDGSTFTGNPILVSPEDTIQYIVTAQNGNCAATDNITVIVYSEGIYRFPTAFTPNGDEQNDTFYPTVQGSAALIRFEIFDRWGNKVHRDANTPWDGAFNGTDLPRDVYIYYAVFRQPDGREFGVKGDVTLLR